MRKKILLLSRKLGCHQRPDRSFFWKGHQFPVCARCTGVFTGQIIAICIWAFIKTDLMVCVDFCLVLLLDWLLQYLKIKESTNLRRFLTGILGGFGMMSIEFEILSIMVKFFQTIIE